MIASFRLASLISLSLFLAACGAPDNSASGAAAAKTTTVEDRGRMTFSASCAVCHSVKDPSDPGYSPLVGPSLFAVVGAPAGHVDNYSYSKAMRESGLTWDEATLEAFLENPQRTVPRTRMAYAGEPDPEKRAAIIAFLKAQK